MGELGRRDGREEVWQESGGKWRKETRDLEAV